MKVIYKYTLKDSGIQSILMPQGAKFLSCAYQRGVLQVWAIVEKDHAEIPYVFDVVTTGSGCFYSKEQCIGMATTDNQQYIVHVFLISK